MNCRKIDDLIPLFIGGDLEVDETRAVTSHLECCASCRSSENEYRATLLMMAEYEPPRFDDRVLANMRLQVLADIESTSRKPILAAIWDLFRAQYSWSTAVIILIVITVLALIRTDPRRNGAERVVNWPHGPAVDERTARQQESPRNEDGVMNNPTHTQPLGAKQRVLGKRPISVQPIATRRHKKTHILETPAQEYVAANYLNPEQPLLRVELQTKDPNIRIIWFSKPRNSN